MAEQKKRKWIKAAVNPEHKGQFAAKANAAGMSTRDYAEKHKHDKDETGKQANLAITLMGMQHHKQSRTAAGNRKALYGHE